jgi:hypothetical protein
LSLPSTAVEGAGNTVSCGVKADARELYHIADPVITMNPFEQILLMLKGRSRAEVVQYKGES